MKREALENVLFVGAGGCAGSVLRYALAGFVHRLVPLARFPWGTFAVNVLGCLAIGFLAGLVDMRQMLGPRARLFLMVGLLGGFTTFSTFGYETVGLLQDGQRSGAAFNVVLHVTAGLAAVWIGYGLSRLG